MAQSKVQPAPHTSHLFNIGLWAVSKADLNPVIRGTGRGNIILLSNNTNRNIRYQLIEQLLCTYAICEYVCVYPDVSPYIQKTGRWRPSHALRTWDLIHQLSSLPGKTSTLLILFKNTCCKPEPGPTVIREALVWQGRSSGELSLAKSFPLPLPCPRFLPLPIPLTSSPPFCPAF